MSEESNEPQGQAGAAVSEEPAEGSVEVGEQVDPTDEGQSSDVAQVVDDGGPDGSSSQDAAEG